MMEVQIYDDEGKSAVSGNALVRIPEEQSTELVPITATSCLSQCGRTTC